MIRWTATVALMLAAFPVGALTGSGESATGVLDTQGPSASGLHVSRSVARIGEPITIGFTLSETPASLPSVTVNGAPAQFVSQDGTQYLYTFTPGPTQPTGPAEVRVVATDSAGNRVEVTDTSVLELDLSNLPLRGWALTAVCVALGLLAVHRLRKVAVVLALGVLWAPQAAAQAPTVSNVAFVQQARPSGGTEVVITYDLASPACCCDIAVTLSKDGGGDGYPFPVASVTGDTEGVTQGVGKRVVWDIAADYPNELIPVARLRVTATARPCDTSAWDEQYPGHLFSNSAACQNNLKRVGIAVKTFANNNQGDFPRLFNESGRLMFRSDEILPYCTIEPEILLCPGRTPESPPPFFDDKHYVYTGYLLTNDQDVQAFAAAYGAEIAGGGAFSGDLPVASSYGDTIMRLKEGVERFIITDINEPNAGARAQARIPVMFDWPDNHQQGWGGNVLYMDGHVSFQKYPGEFPMTETAIATFAALAGYVPPTAWNEPDPDPPYAPWHDPYGYALKCGQQVREVAVSLHMFANENAGNFLPELSGESGRLMMIDTGFYPVYLTNPNWLICPGADEITPPPHFDDPHYAYLGYAMLTDGDVAAFAGAYAAQAPSGFSGNLPIATSYGNTMYRLKEGVEELLVMDVNGTQTCVPASYVPVLVEWPDNHEGRSGGHVLYLDGHVKWMPYPGAFPMTESAIASLRALAERAPATAWADPQPAYTPEHDPYGFVRECRGRMGGATVAGRMFAGEHSGMWPRLSATQGNLMMREDEVYPEYWGNPVYFVCPGPQPLAPPPHFSDRHYVYFGYALLNDADVSAFASAYAGGGDFSADLPVASSYGDSLLRLRDGIQRFWITDINNPASGYIGDHEIPVMMEWPGNHEGLTGGHVLYLDGHTEWHDYPGEFPMTEATVATLDALADWTPVNAWATKEYTLENDSHGRALCEFNEKYLNLAMKTFNGHHLGKYPPLSTTPNNLMFETEEVVPYHLNDLRRLNCPGSALACQTPVAGDHSYVFLGYVVATDADVSAFAAAYEAQLAVSGDFSGDLPATTSYGNALLRLREGLIGSFGVPELAPIGAHRLPVLIEWPDNHGPLRGGNVLYLDGHVEWQAYPGAFPMTEAAISVLTNLAGRPPVN